MITFEFQDSTQFQTTSQTKSKTSSFTAADCSAALLWWTGPGKLFVQGGGSLAWFGYVWLTFLGAIIWINMVFRSSILFIPSLFSSKGGHYLPLPLAMRLFQETFFGSHVFQSFFEARLDGIHLRNVFLGAY